MCTFQNDGNWTTIDGSSANLVIEKSSTYIYFQSDISEGRVNKDTDMFGSLKLSMILLFELLVAFKTSVNRSTEFNSG